MNSDATMHLVPPLNREEALRRYEVISRQEASLYADLPPGQIQLSPQLSPAIWSDVAPIITDQRIWRSKSLLARTELPVTDVCAQVGYHSLGSFSSLFKKRVGSPPTAWQQRSRET